MHENEGIRCAIQSLAGVYIYDYVPEPRIRQRINQRYLEADAHFSNMLTSPENTEIGKGSEVITMAVILSMQDVSLCCPELGILSEAFLTLALRSF